MNDDQAPRFHSSINNSSNEPQNDEFDEKCDHTTPAANVHRPLNYDNPLETRTRGESISARTMIMIQALIITMVKHHVIP